ncbi:MAG TPA: ribonuclease HII [Oceanipulchritudo sp.]|nr:ribonuclease HII [Oceanipulchritudo sp.]
MPLGLVGFDKRALGNAPCLVGIDEAGRGCLAGPVVAAAIRCGAPFYNTSWCRRHSRGVDDSKRLSAEKRQAIVERFAEARREDWIQIGIGTASVEEIERHNIYHATTLAMRRALAAALAAALGWDQGDQEDLWDPAVGGKVLIDGRPIKNFPCLHQAVVKGDQRSLAIALAGIHAKEHRDALMAGLDQECPGYGFRVHKGYGTEAHLDALRKLGPCPHHRPTFLRKFHAGEQEVPDSSQCSLF